MNIGKMGYGVFTLVVIAASAMSLSCGEQEACLRVDLDGDGVNEIIKREGEWSIGVYRKLPGKAAELKKVGRMEGNGDFFVTSDRRLVCLCGSQGGADIAVMRGDSLEHIGDYIDKTLFSSKAFRDLEYDYDDDSRNCRKHPPLLEAEKYIICNRESIYGDHVLKIDLDKDGQEEQLYLGNPRWGAISYDMARVHTRTEAYPFIPFMTEDSIAFMRPEHELEECAHFRNCIQLSAIDIDSNGRYEVAVTAGSVESNSTYLFTFDRKEGLKLLRHFYHNGMVKEENLKEIF